MHLSKLIKEPLEYEVDNELLEKLKKEFYSNREDYSPELITQIAANKSRNSVILNRLKEIFPTQLSEEALANIAEDLYLHAISELRMDEENLKKTIIEIK